MKAILGFLILLGTAGASDLGTISIWQTMGQAAIGMILLYSDGKKYRNYKEGGKKRCQSKVS